jgi:predicted transcriptional regulator
MSRVYSSVSVSVPPKFKVKLDKMAKKLGVSRSIIIRKALVDLLKAGPKKGNFKPF